LPVSAVRLAIRQATTCFASSEQIEYSSAGAAPWAWLAVFTSLRSTLFPRWHSECRAALSSVTSTLLLAGQSFFVRPGCLLIDWCVFRRFDGEQLRVTPVFAAARRAVRCKLKWLETLTRSLPFYRRTQPDHAPTGIVDYHSAVEKTGSLQEGAF